jgi:hypothetical protein
MHREIVVPFSDLRMVSIECGDCHALIVLDIEGQHDVTKCPACNREFEPAVKNSLTRWRGLYDLAKEAKQKLSFRIPAVEPRP